MAVAGLHNVSVLDSSFLRESQSPVSRHWINQDRPSSRASSLLQMWRELEGETVRHHPQVRIAERLRQPRDSRLNADLACTYLSDGQGNNDEVRLQDADVIDDGCRTWTQSQIGSQNEHDDGISSSSEQSSDFGEEERERVRKTFREWMNSGVRANASHMNNCSREQWLGENERERVRIIREWVQMTTQDRGTFVGCSEEQDVDIGVQIEQIRDGSVANHCAIGGRKAIRRLCGRQALLDLLLRAKRERQKELQDLLDHRPVSGFSHRNRIQSLLRGRFLRNERLILDERPMSMAATELGLLRQRHTVSDLREGFLSRVDNSVCGSASSCQFDSSSDNDMSSSRVDHIQLNNSNEFCEYESSNGERDVGEMCTDVMEGSVVNGVINWQGSAAQVRQGQVVENEEIEHQMAPNFEVIERRDDMMENGGVSRQGSTAYEQLQENLGNGSEQNGHQPEVIEVFEEQYVLNDESGDALESSDQTDSYEGNLVENTNWLDNSAQRDEWQRSVIDDDEEIVWQRFDNTEFNESRNGTGEDMARNWQGVTASQRYQVTPESEGGEHSLQESHEVFHEDGIEGAAMDNWLDGTSSGVSAAVGRDSTFYFPDDDNEYNPELRELLSRRSVSNLLQSGFRESLDRLIQSYVERQGNASVDTELDGTDSTPSLVEQYQEQQRDPNEGHSVAVERNSLVFPSAPVTPSQPLWEHDWPHHNLHQRSGIEWEIINDLRIDMARLQQRMNNMQRMLEACMDMQLELQRSVRQEVSAALNRSADSAENCPPLDEGKWEYVRKGICCICCDSNIDSLLYRCGHMCTCSTCANKLVQGKGKCPMCWAPVVEVIRAYSIQ